MSLTSIDGTDVPARSRSTVQFNQYSRSVLLEGKDHYAKLSAGQEPEVGETCLWSVVSLASCEVAVSHWGG